MNIDVTDRTNNYWGFWATLALGILVFLVFSAVQTIGLLSYVYTVDALAVSAITNPDSGININHLLSKYMLNGDAIATAEIPAAIIGVAMILWFVWLRRPLTIDEYLDLNIPSVKSLLTFLGLIILFMVLMESVNVFLDRPTPEFMTSVYSNTQNLPLLWIAVSVAAPFFEEFLFRGFLLEGLSRSRLGIVGATVITSAAWAIIHMQYGWFEIISIFLIGILLCVAKFKSKSLYVPIAMHMLMNLTASIGMQLTQ